jgi:hypothetical protein
MKRKTYGDAPVKSPKVPKVREIKSPKAIARTSAVMKGTKNVAMKSKGRTNGMMPMKSKRG